MSKKVAKSLCDIVGEVRKSPDSTEDDGGNFFRVRVNIDISLPLCRGGVITLENGEKAWVHFQYERLPNFCYWCGRLDHGDKQCNPWIQSKGSLSTDKQEFGSFLKAAPYQRGSKNVFHVPGWFENETTGKEKGETVAPGAVEVELGGKVKNSNSILNSESTTILGNNESLREASVGEILSPVLPPTKFSELIPNESSFLSKLSEIDEDIRKFDSETCGKRDTPLPEAILPIGLCNSKNLKEVQILDFPSENDMILQKENLVPQVLCDITNTKNSPAPIQGKWTRLMKSVGTNSSQPEEVLICGIGKRNQDDSRVLSELPSKRRRVLKGDVAQSKILAEAGHQLRQTQ